MTHASLISEASEVVCKIRFGVAAFMSESGSLIDS